MENQYINYYKRHSVKELRQVISQPNSYQDEARFAALQLLKEKGEELSAAELEAFKAIEASLKTEEKEKKAKKEKEQQGEEEIPEWYSLMSVLGFSVFLSPIFGAILLSYNLKKANKKNEAVYAIILGIFFLVLGMVLVYIGYMTQIVSLGISVVASLIFIELLWKKHLGVKTKYKRKPIWKPLIITVGVIVLLFGIQAYFNPELLDEIIKMQSQ